MNRFLKNSIVAAALAATTLSAIPTAQAGERHHRRQHVVQKADNADLIVAGLLGLAVGAIVVTALNDEQGGGVRNNGDLSVNYFPPAPGETVSYGWEKPERPTENDPRNRRWYKYCEDSYRDFKRNATVGGNERFSCAYR